MKIKKKETRGGKRPNSGRLPKYNEPTKVIAFRVPISHIDSIKALITAYLLELEQSKLLINILDTEKPQP